MSTPPRLLCPAGGSRAPQNFCYDMLYDTWTCLEAARAGWRVHPGVCPVVPCDMKSLKSLCERVEQKPLVNPDGCVRGRGEEQEYTGIVAAPFIIVPSQRSPRVEGHAHSTLL